MAAVLRQVRKKKRKERLVRTLSSPGGTENSKISLLEHRSLAAPQA